MMLHQLMFKYFVPIQNSNNMHLFVTSTALSQSASDENYEHYQMILLLVTSGRENSESEKRRKQDFFRETELSPTSVCIPLSACQPM
jgi:hypothetical protein